MLFSRIAIAMNEMIKHFAMRFDMAINIHRHKAGKLQKARIDLPHKAWIGQRHLYDAVLFEPFDTTILRQLVNLGRAFTRIDRAPH